MDDDELMSCFVEYVMLNGSEDAIAIAGDPDGSWFDLDPGETSDLMHGFADEYGWVASIEISRILVGGT